MHAQPNYGVLLQSFWSPPTPSIEHTEQGELTEPTALVDFLGEELLWQHAIPAQEADLSDIPADLPSALVHALTAQGIQHLYSHQLKALQTIRKGKSLILTSPTASGKTLSAYPGMLEGCLNEGHRALAFYGLRALALDQFHKLSAFLSAMPLESRPGLGMITGDVEPKERDRILASAPHILGVTPELIHFQLKQAWKAAAWAAFYERLRYILIDEAHTFSGCYGANMTWLLRRIKLAVDRYGGDSKKLQFIFLSATCGNPRQLAKKLASLKPTQRDPKPLLWIRKSGAAVPPRQVIVTQPSYNLTADTARLIQFLLAQGKSGIAFCNSRRSVRDLTGLLKTPQVAAFYSGMTTERRSAVMTALQQGTIRWLIATEALEAGIDLPALECCVMRGYPGSKMAYQQRSGRAGRSQPGLTVLIPNALSAIDRYIAEHPEMLITGDIEDVSFNDTYPIFAAKHLLCAAAETGIPMDQIKHYFGKDAVEIVRRLMTQGHLHQGRNGLWARGYPHRDVNFRGGSSQTLITLVEAESGEELEAMSVDVAYREVHPHAIYKRQDGMGQIVTYQCLALDVDRRQTILKQVPDSAMFTTAITKSETSSANLLTDPVAMPLTLPTGKTGSMRLELSFGQVNHITSGYHLLTQLYEQTCLNQRCLNHKEPLPDERRCPVCSKLTRKALIVKPLAEESFEQPYQTQFATPIVRLTIDDPTQDYIQEHVRAVRTSLSRSGQPIPPGYQQLWQYPSAMIAMHSFGHQLLNALPLVAKVDPQEVNFVVVPEAGCSYAGCFYDTADGGSGAAEAVFKQLPSLAQAAAEIARGCDCEVGCAKCLIQYGCPDGNTGLLKQLGLVLLDAIF